MHRTCWDLDRQKEEREAERHSDCPNCTGTDLESWMVEVKVRWAQCKCGLTYFYARAIFKPISKNECGTFLGKVWTHISILDYLKKKVCFGDSSCDLILSIILSQKKKLMESKCATNIISWQAQFPGVQKSSTYFVTLPMLLIIQSRAPLWSLTWFLVRAF